MYYCPTNASVATMVNCPTGNAFSLLIEKHAGVKQTLTEYMVTGFKTWVRNYYTTSNAWGSWIQQETTERTGDFTKLKTTAKDTLVNSINELFTFANDGKTAVAYAVAAMGVSAIPSDTFAVLANKIGQIKTGVKFASGTTTIINNEITVRGLSFKPIHVFLRFGTDQFGISINEGFNYVRYAHTLVDNNSGYGWERTIYNDGFKFNVYPKTGQVDWYAVGD